MSVASIWEIAVKVSLRKLRLARSVNDFVKDRVLHGFEILPITCSHAAGVEHLPYHHKDPFDRLLASQALAENLPFVTADPQFARYGIRIIWQ